MAELVVPDTVAIGLRMHGEGLSQGSRMECLARTRNDT